MDADTGIMYAKGPAHAIMKTEEALFLTQQNIAMMSTEKLNDLKAIIMTKGDVKIIAFRSFNFSVDIMAMFC